MLHFKLFGFPVRVQWMFWVVGCLLNFGLLTSKSPVALRLLLVWLVVFFVSIIWHELGHAFAMRRFGGRPDILLYGMGGLCSGMGHYTRNQSMFVSAAGPAAGFTLALISVGLSLTPLYQNGYAKYAIDQLIFINIVWTVLNLFPILPLDGGQILRAFMANRNPSVVPKVGMIAAGAAAILGLVLNRSIMAMLFGYLAYQNWQMTRGYSNQRPF